MAQEQNQEVPVDMVEVIVSIKVERDEVSWRTQKIAVRNGKLVLVGPEVPRKQKVQATFS